MNRHSLFMYLCIVSLALLGTWCVLHIIVDLRVNTTVHAPRTTAFMQQVTYMHTNPQGQVQWTFHTPLLKEGAYL